MTGSCRRRTVYAQAAVLLCGALWSLSGNILAGGSMTGGVYTVYGSGVVPGGGFSSGAVYTVAGTLSTPPGGGHSENASLPLPLQVFAAIYTPAIPEPGALWGIVCAVLMRRPARHPLTPTHQHNGDQP